MFLSAFTNFLSVRADCDHAFSKPQDWPIPGFMHEKVFTCKKKANVKKEKNPEKKVC